MLDDGVCLVDQAVSGDEKALESLVVQVEDVIYNLSLRILGSLHDAEDATQEIIIRVITQLSTFRKESAFTTWVYRIAVNYLINYKKSMFAQHPLSFDMYAEDIQSGFVENSGDLLQHMDENLLAEELKLSCTNVMLQCLDPESRCIYVLGIMFRADSKACGEILGITPEAYRQRLSRIRKKVGDFLGAYCGLTATGVCNCRKRVGYAIQSHRLDPQALEYSGLNKLDDSVSFGFVQAMERMDELSQVFTDLPKYRSPQAVQAFLRRLMQSSGMKTIQAEA